jgi:hypothetical protein
MGVPLVVGREAFAASGSFRSGTGNVEVEVGVHGNAHLATFSSRGSGASHGYPMSERYGAAQDPS